MKFIVLVFGVFFTFGANAQVQLPLGAYSYESQSLLMARHTLILQNLSSVDMERVTELKEDGYSCQRLPRVHRCKKTIKDVPFETVVTPSFLKLVFEEASSVNTLVAEADPEQYEVSQNIFYDGVASESGSYKLYLNSNGALYFDPTLGEMVRLRLLETGELNHMGIKNIIISRNESYRLFINFLYLSE